MSAGYPGNNVKPAIVNFGEIACGDSAGYGVIVENLGYGKLDINMVNITSGGFFSVLWVILVLETRYGWGTIDCKYKIWPT